MISFHFFIVKRNWRNKWGPFKFDQSYDEIDREKGCGCLFGIFGMSVGKKYPDPDYDWD